MQENERQDGMTMKKSFNIVYSFALAHQRALTVPLRERYGKEALGLPALCGFLLILGWAAFSYDPLMWVYAGYWLLCLVVRRVESLRLSAKGERIYSLYDGFPHVAHRLTRKGGENMEKLIVEPVLVCVVGTAAYFCAQEWQTPPGLAYFLLLGLFTLPLVEGVKQIIWRKRAQAVLDARLEQQTVAEIYRGKFGDS
jgi:hypothetical protein